MGNSVKDCRSCLFQESDFACDLQDSKPASEVACAFRESKRCSVSHSTTESEFISSDTGLRMDGILALDLWNLVIGV